MAGAATIEQLLEEYERVYAYTDSLWLGLSDEELHWRPHELSSAIAWHVGHVAAVAHFLVRNLTAAEALIDPDIDAVMDSATPEPERGALPGRDRLADYRARVADRVRFRMGDIRDGNVAAPEQMVVVATGLLTMAINHEYQHDRWVGEVLVESLGRTTPPLPTSPLLTVVDGYTVVR